MPLLRLAVAAAHFDRDLSRCLERVRSIMDGARRAGADLLVLPHAALGGYLADLRAPHADSLPPALTADDPCFAELAAHAGDLTVCLGYTELDGPDRYNAAVCLSGDGVLGRHRKVHQTPGENEVYGCGDGFRAFDTAVGRLGMLIDYDKTFPEAARTLALDGVDVIACLSAWPASATNRAPRLSQDRQTRLFDLYDGARAAENQVFLLSANQTGVTGELRFLGQAKVVGPGGEVLARTYAAGGLAVAEVDVAAEIARARLVLRHLQERRPDTYRTCAHERPAEVRSPRALSRR
jgi:predicted amidohydrolase